MPSAPPFAGASARRQARQLQHLPFRARPLHRSHAASILLFRFHHGNSLSFRSTLDRSHGDCSRSAARPTDRLIFSPRFFLFVLVGERPFHRVDAPGGLPSFLHPQPSHTGWGSPPYIKGVHTQAVQLSVPPRQCSLLRLRVFARSVGRAQCPLGCTGSDRRATFGDSTTALGLWRKRNPSRRFHRPPPAVCSRFAPLPYARRSVSPPQRCLCARHANGTTRAPADSTFPFPVSAAPGAAEPIHPSFSLSFPCPKSFSRGCC